MVFYYDKPNYENLENDPIYDIVVPFWDPKKYYDDMYTLHIDVDNINPGKPCMHDKDTNPFNHTNMATSYPIIQFTDDEEHIMTEDS